MVLPYSARRGQLGEGTEVSFPDLADSANVKSPQRDPIVRGKPTWGRALDSGLRGVQQSRTRSR